MSKEILKHTKQYIEDDVLEWVIQKCFQGSKSDYWDILSITTNLFYYYLFRTEETINCKKICKQFLDNPLYNKSSDETIKKFISPMKKHKNISYQQ